MHEARCGFGYDAMNKSIILSAVAVFVIVECETRSTVDKQELTDCGYEKRHA